MYPFEPHPVNGYDLRLLFTIRNPVRSRRSCPSDRTGQDQHGENVRDHLNKFGGHDLFRKVGLDRFAQPEQ